MSRQCRGPRSGFSITELVVAVCVISILAGMAVLNTQGTFQNYKANAARDQVVTQLRLARELAITKRRNVRVDFIAPNQIQTTVQYRNGETPGVPIAPLYLNNAEQGTGNGAQFYVFPSLPDTPMGFGNTQAVSLSQPSGAGAWTVMFTTSGALVGTSSTMSLDMVGNSNPVNASIFIGIPSTTSSARAVTVLGATGRVRSYMWDSTKWTE
ncbi:MAG TPA: prepilin-type N-terminal cleavage/methylation domain-containing protein [Candidatus Acidoferrum sp.]